jgi:hypothetical protein
MDNDLKTKLLDIFPPRDYFRARVVRSIKRNNSLETNSLLKEMIELGSPALVARLGVTEAQVINCYLDISQTECFSFWPSKIVSRYFYSKRTIQLRDLAGVYPVDDETVKEFVNLHQTALSNADVIGVWGKTYTSIEYFYVKSNAVIINQAGISPWLDTDPSMVGNWAHALRGKEVLVVSPFIQEFQDQLIQIDRVFQGRDFPKANFKFLMPPLTQGGRNDGKNWLIHLNEIKDKMAKLDFDVALISAGSYALPLAMHAKNLGKIGINCGGELQLFFGVIGKRWEKSPRVISALNEHWIRPYESNRPENWKSIEDGCYW